MIKSIVTVGKQRAYFQLKYFKIVKMRDAKFSLNMAPKITALYS